MFMLLERKKGVHAQALQSIEARNNEIERELDNYRSLMLTRDRELLLYLSGRKETYG